MNTTERLRPLFESANGIHLTVYINNGQGIAALRRLIEEQIVAAKKHLTPVMSAEELERFLRPIRDLSRDGNLLPKMLGSIGIFRTPSSFRVMNLPIEVDPACIVATTFHVKPLLRWMQVDRDFVIVGLDDRAAHLYRGNLNSFSSVDCILYPDSLRRPAEENRDLSFSDSRRLRKANAETMEWLGSWLATSLTEPKPKIFVAGSPMRTESLRRALRDLGIDSTPLSPFFSPERVSGLRFEARAALRRETKRLISETLIEFYHAEESRRGMRNLFQIAKDAVRGRVRKLIVADNVRLFGKFDRLTGNLSIHLKDSNHEDDDVLDDIAQEVIAQGGEVVVAKMDEIPGDSAVYAIVDGGKPSREKEAI